MSGGEAQWAGLRTRFFRSIRWSFVATAVSQGFGLMTSVALARMLGAEAFGEYGAIQSTLVLFGLFAGVGLGTTSARYTAYHLREDPEEASAILASTLQVGLLLAAAAGALLWIFAEEVAGTWMHLPGRGEAVRWSSMLLLVNAIQGIHNGALTGCEDFEGISWLNAGRGVAQALGVTAGAYGGGLEGAFAGAVAAGVVGTALSDVWLRRVGERYGLRVGYATNRIRWKVLGAYSLPALVANIVSSPATWLVNMLVLARPGGAMELGVLNAAGSWRTAIVYLPNVVGQVLVPMSARLQSGGGGQIGRLTRSAIRINAAVSLAVAAGLAAMSGRVMAMYGEEFAGRGAVLTLIGMAGVLSAVQSPFGNVLTGLGKMWLGALMNAVVGVVFLAVAWVLIERGYGATGVAVALGVSQGVNLVWSVALLRRVVDGAGE